MPQATERNIFVLGSKLTKFLVKVNNRKARKRCEIRSKLTMKTLKRGQ